MDKDLTQTDKKLIEANIKLQDEIKNIKLDNKILACYILGNDVDEFLVNNIISKYKNVNSPQARGHYQKNN